MSCHESLMARRRKKSRAAAAQAKAASNAQSPMFLDKSLPSLPPSAIPPSALPSGRDTPGSDPYADTPTELSPMPRAPASRQGSKSSKRDRSPLSPDESKKGMRPVVVNGMTLTAQKTSRSRHRHMMTSATLHHRRRRNVPSARFVILTRSTFRLCWTLAPHRPRTMWPSDKTPRERDQGNEGSPRSETFTQESEITLRECESRLHIILRTTGQVHLSRRHLFGTMTHGQDLQREGVLTCHIQARG